MPDEGAMTADLQAFVRDADQDEIASFLDSASRIAETISYAVTLAGRVQDRDTLACLLALLADREAKLAEAKRLETKYERCAAHHEGRFNTVDCYICEARAAEDEREMWEERATKAEAKLAELQEERNLLHGDVQETTERLTQAEADLAAVVARMAIIEPQAIQAEATLSAARDSIRYLEMMKGEAEATIRRLHQLIANARAYIDPEKHPEWEAAAFAETEPCDELHDKLEKAEATLTRVRDLPDEWERLSQAGQVGGFAGCAARLRRALIGEES